MVQLYLVEIATLTNYKLTQNYFPKTQLILVTLIFDPEDRCNAVVIDTH
jgi:hypothetical protein